MTSSGYILYDKPAGVTSFAALRGMRTSFGASKVGHAGTLDSFATGLLLVVVGSYSRLVPWLVGLDKVYEAEFEFGTATDTLDPVGNVIGTSGIPELSALQSALPSFQGPQLQLPPDYSAIHIAGQRASDLARKGIVPRLEARSITIYSLELLEFQGAICKVRIHCSSGTYVRAIARDLAAACGALAHVTSLRRISIGPFGLDGSVGDSTADFHESLREFTPDDAKSIGLKASRIPHASETAFSHGTPSLLNVLSSEMSAPAAASAAASAATETGSDLAVFTEENRLLGIVGVRESAPRYLMVVPLPGVER